MIVYKVNTKKLKLNVRKSPSLKGKVVGRLSKGTTVTVKSISNGWAYITSPKEGYVKASLLRKVESATPITPVATDDRSNAQKIADLAYEYAYKTNDSKARYKGGKPTVAYKQGFEKAFPYSERKKWKYASHRVGANCGAFVGTCVRNAGIEPKFPHTSQAAYKYLDKTNKWERIPLDGKLENGDIIVYHKGSDGHICIHYDGQIKEANYNGFYPKTTNSLKARLSTTGKSKVRVYRARG